MEDTRETQLPVADVSDPIATDLPCAFCSYNLRGVRRDGACPECGRPVERTINEDLRLANPAWLAFQARTMLWLIAVGLLNTQTPGPIYERWAMPLLFTFASSAALLYACWRLGTPEGDEPPEDMLGTQQRAVRLAGIAAAGLAVLDVISYVFDGLWKFRSDLALGAMFFIRSAVIVVLDWLVVMLVYRLARRVRPAEPSLIGHAKLVLWALPIAHLALVLTGLASLLIEPGASESASNVIATVWTVIQWCSPVVIMAFAMFCGRMHQALARAASESESKPAPSMTPASAAALSE